ncbi:MAG TPA: alpha-amylase family glycosyl hydrolase [Blastocatellia bacterium]|nr:alpha-amylase family glycosyl hydrolase [Blastocatellia bacterium]
MKKNRMHSLKPFALLARSMLLLLFVASTGAAEGAPEVLKVEPPNWWAAHTVNPVRLLVRGHNLSGARVTATRAEAQPSAAVVNPAGSYLFVSVAINPAARPGEYPLTLETASGKTSIPFSISPPLDPSKNFQGVTTDDIIYLIMPDRFADGDQSNDAPADSPREANDRKNPRAFHGGDFRGIINRLPYLKELGVTALWLTPWYDNWNGVKTCDKPWCPNTYYHGYHAIDYYAVEDRFGGLATLRELIEKAHAMGLKVIQDQVANHVGSQHPWVKDPPLDNWFHGTLDRHLQNEFRGDLLLSPHATSESRRPTLDGWFSDDLPDMNQDEPEVARYEIQNSLWWVAMTGVDGIRQDTIQYMPRRFIRELGSALRRQYGRIWMVGEVFDRDPAHTAFFMGGRAGWDGVDTMLDSGFDFPLWQTSLDVFTGKKPARALRDMLKYDVLYTDPSRLTTMTGNHDVRRFVSLEGGTPVGAMLHLAFTLTVRGTPQLYYGDEIAMEGGDDPDNRRDFPGGWTGDARNAFEARGRTPAEQRMYEWTRDWIRLRKEHGALRRGHLFDLAFDDDVYVYARRDGGEAIVIAINRAPVAKQVSFSAAPLDAVDGLRLAPLLIAKEIVTVAGGAVTLNLPAQSAAAYKVTSPDSKSNRVGIVRKRKPRSHGDAEKASIFSVQLRVRG